MATYRVYLQDDEGSLTITFKKDGRLCSFDFTDATLSDKRLTDIFRNMPITENEFTRRADGGGTKYEKITQ